MGCAIGALQRGCRDQPGYDAGPRSCRRLADLRAEPGGRAPRAGTGRRAGTRRPGCERTGSQWLRGSYRAGEVSLCQEVSSLQSSGSRAPRLRGCKNECSCFGSRTCWEAQSLGFRLDLPGWCAPWGAQKLRPLRALSGGLRTSLIPRKTGAGPSWPLLAPCHLP